MRISLTVLCLVALAAAGLVGGCGHKPTPAPAVAPPMPPVVPPTSVAPPAPEPASSAASAASAKALGKTIFTTGNGATGTHIEFEKGGTQFKAKPGGCAVCHGEDGKGKKVGKTTIPDIRPSTLIAKHGTKAPKYTWASLKKAIEEGIGANSKPLSDVMPRFKLTDEEFGGLTAYMAALSKPAAKPVAKAATKPATKAPADAKGAAKAKGTDKAKGKAKATDVGG